MDGDDDVGVKVIAQDVRGQIVEDAAIDEKVAAGCFDGREDAGNGDGSANGYGQRAAPLSGPFDSSTAVRMLCFYAGTPSA